MDHPGGRAAFRPVRLSTVDLLSVADAIPLLDRLALLVAMRRGGDRETVIFGILGGLQRHLDATAPASGSRGVQETIDAVRGWFDMRIAEEEARASATR
jgi:hypothetical protein